MKLNLKIPELLKIAYNQELKAYHHHLLEGRYTAAWHHLERTHIIGQSYPIEHTYSHWLMFRFGQMLRLLVGGWKSFINHVPPGNTGGSNVPPLKTTPLPSDIEELFNKI